VFEKLGFSFSGMQIQLTLFVIKTALIIVSKQVFNKDAFVDHLI
jgi:hypothetical protein